AIGPAPMLTPPTTDSAAAAVAQAATRRFRTKYNRGAGATGGTTAEDGVCGSGCPNDRDVKTSSNVAGPCPSAHSGFDPPMILHCTRLLGWAHAARSLPVSESQTPPLVQP